MKILFVCTGNSCRSQMAEGILKSFKSDLQVFSAGIKPEREITPYTYKVLDEIGINISGQYPKNIKIFEEKEFDYVITLSENAKLSVNQFDLSVKNNLHFDIEDPFEANGSEKEILRKYRTVRDEILKNLRDFVNSL